MAAAARSGGAPTCASARLALWVSSVTVRFRAGLVWCVSHTLLRAIWAGVVYQSVEAQYFDPALPSTLLTPLDLDDDASVTVALPFNLTFSGVLYESIAVSSN